MYFVHPQIKLRNLRKINLLQKLVSYFPERQLIFTDMGRSAFKIIIEKLNLRNSEILFPAYICDIFYPIFKIYNLKPIFLDIELKTFHLKTEEVEKKITSQTKAILVCHTYGLPFEIKKIQNRGLIVIEDCAHFFGSGSGRQGKAAFFSLYKQFPISRGGMLVSPQNWQIQLPKTYFNFRDFLSLLNCFPFFAFLFKKFGKNIAPRILRKEKLFQPAGLNNFSLKLFALSFKDFEESLEKRKKIALFFQKELKALGFEVQEEKNNIFTYLSALVPKNLIEKRDEIVQKLNKYRIFPTRIWHSPIIFNPEVQKEYQINLREFPNTVEAAKRIINFPLQNSYSEKDIQKMIISLQKVINQID